MPNQEGKAECINCKCELELTKYQRKTSLCDECEEARLLSEPWYDKLAKFLEAK